MTKRNCTNIKTSKQAVKKAIDTDSFIARSKEKYGDRFTYEDTEFLGSTSKIKVNCRKHGLVNIRAASHFRNMGCSKCSCENDNRRLTHDKFISRCKIVHGDTYDYKLVKYSDNKSKVLIVCLIHGEFTQAPYSHLRGSGCPSCARAGNSARSIVSSKSRGKPVNNGRVSKDEFIVRARKAHGDKYDYSLVNFKNLSSKVDIICSTHGKFNQLASAHSEGRGCRQCGFEFGGYGRSRFKRLCDKNNKGNGLFYILRCQGNNESFYKTGITSRSVKRRYRAKSKLPYDYVEQFVFDGEANYIYDIENIIQALLKDNHYRPLIDFQGSVFECFTSIKPVEKLVAELSSTRQLQLLA